MDYSRYKNLKVETKGKVAVVTMNRPEALNAIDRVMHKELEDIFYDLAKDDDVRAVILTGAGRAFSAGGDIKGMKMRREDPEHYPLPRMDESIKLLTNIIDLPQPVIAAVNGACIGEGASLAFACDIIFVSENARIADPHVRVGVSAGDGGCVMWPLLMGMAKAKEYLFTGDALDVRNAERMGIINKVVPAEQVMPEAMAFAQRLATDIPPIALKYTKMSINKVVKERLDMIMPTSIALEFLCFATNDHLEAINAFLEKRKPTFTGT